MCHQILQRTFALRAAANSTETPEPGFGLELFAPFRALAGDAVGERDPKASSDFCAYSALDGVYGTITLVPLAGPYDPKTALAPEFVEQEDIGGKRIGEGTVKAGGASVYARTYETTSLEDLHYRTQFSASAVGNWAVQVTLEYASPRDDAVKQEFLNAVYSGALKTLAAK